ncbi:MAG TPA: hypothetical protein VFS68_02245, partial [Candidatus Udaeobacter sp.]|nr:hypothetical protein [Candidatus Udaeobacter sp.]
MRALTKAEILGRLNAGFGGFTEEGEWPKAKSTLSERYSAPSRGRLDGLQGENGSTRLELFG